MLHERHRVVFTNQSWNNISAWLENYVIITNAPWIFFTHLRYYILRLSDRYMPGKIPIPLLDLLLLNPVLIMGYSQIRYYGFFMVSLSELFLIRKGTNSRTSTVFASFPDAAMVLEADALTTLWYDYFNLLGSATDSYSVQQSSSDHFQINSG